ncbi:unnamed protein product [Urochloa humidicola]
MSLLEGQVKGKRFLGGDTVGYLDLAACQLATWRTVLEEMMGLSLMPDDKYPALQRWADKCTSNEAVKQCLPDRDQLTAYFTANKIMLQLMANAMLRQ